METLIEIVHVLVALFMILVVLVQGGNQGGVGAAFGGGNSSGVFGATGATSLLGKLTYGAAFIFMLTSISLTIIQGKSGEVGLKDRLKASSGESAKPGSPTNPEAVPAPQSAPAGNSAGSPVPAATPEALPSGSAGSPQGEEQKK